MSERSVFNLRYSFPGFTFFVFTLLLSFGEVIARIKIPNLAVYVSFFGFVFILGGGAVGYFVSQVYYYLFYHCKKGFFYNDWRKTQKKDYIKYLTETIDIDEKITDSPDKALVIIDYFLMKCDAKYKEKIYLYITRRWDLYHVIGATEISILLGIISGISLKLYCIYNVDKIPPLVFFEYQIWIFYYRDIAIIVGGLLMKLLFNQGKKRINQEYEDMLNIFFRSLDKKQFKIISEELGTLKTDFFK